MDNSLTSDNELINVMQQTNIAVLEHPLMDPLEKALDAYDLSSRTKIPNLLSEKYSVK